MCHYVLAWGIIRHYVVLFHLLCEDATVWLMLFTGDVTSMWYDVCGSLPQDIHPRPRPNAEWQALRIYGELCYSADVQENTKSLVKRR